MSSNANSTIDPNRLDFHRTLVGNWWGEDNKVKPLHTMNSIRVPFVKNGLVSSVADTANTENCLKGLNVLDLGCGGGIVTEPLALMGATVTGIDPCSELLEVAKTHAEHNPVTKNIRFILGTLEDNINDHENLYDAVVAYEVLQHVANPDILLSFCVRALKPGGSLFVGTQNKTYLAWFHLVILGENVFRCIPKGVHSYNRLVPRHWVQQTLEKNNCRVVNTKGYFYNFFTRACSHDPLKKVSYLLHAVKLSVPSHGQ